MKKHTWLFLFLLAAALAFAGCGGGSSNNEPVDGDTDTDTTENEGTDNDSTVDGDDTDTDTDTTDTDDTVTTDCSTEVCPCKADSECPEGFACNPDTLACAKPVCESDDDCTTEGQKCSATGFCVFTACTKDTDCTEAGYVCDAGVCKKGEDCSQAATVVINEGSGLLTEGATKALTVTVMNANKLVINLPASQITWASDKTDAVAVAAGVLTGGTVSDLATITATLSCKTSVTTNVTYRNYAQVAATDSRVIVFNQTTGALVAGAKVFLTPVAVKDEPTAITTGDDGIALFTGTACTDGCNLHVFTDGYTYVSAFGVKGNNFTMPLTANTNNTVADGVKGHQDMSAIPESLRGDVSIGISMFSIPGNLADLNFTSLIGDMVMTHVKVGTIEQDVTLPSALEGYLNDTDPLKDGFYAVGVPGPATLWGLGGYAVLGDLIDAVSGALGDTIDVGAILGAVMPYFADFYHGIKTGYELTARPKIADADDIDKDDDKTELVANSAAFSTENLKVGQRQTKNVAFTYPTLPTISGTTCADTIVTLVGAMQKGVGFVPLGLNAAVDKKDADDTADCKVGEANDGKVDGVFAPQHSGLLGMDYYTLSVAVPISGLLGKKADGGIDISGSVTRSASAPEAVTVPSFLGFMSDAAITAADSNVTITATKVTGATFHRVVLSKDTTDKTATTYWHIYWADTNAPAAFALPTGIENRAVGFGGASMAQAIKLAGASYDDLFAFGDKNITKMNELLDGFSMHILDGAKK